MSLETNQPMRTAPDSDVSETAGTVPIWLIVAMFMLLYWGAIYFEEHGGWFSAKVYAPYVSAKQVEEFAPGGGGIDGGAVFAARCAVCHQATGQGMPGQFPPLAGSDWVNEKEPGRMIRIVLNGLTGPITVSQKPFNGTMVPWASLPDEEIAAVITFVRQNKQWGNSASAVTPEQVAAVRKKLEAEGRSSNFTPDELLKISPAE
jgi:mono/diheme cytochrome c family protein